MGTDPQESLESIAWIERVAGKVAPGRSVSFTEAHVLKALEITSLTPGTGRKRLSEILGLGEGMTRTLLRHLRAEGLIAVSRKGLALTDRGRSISADLNALISVGVNIPASSLTVGSRNYAVLVRGAAYQIRSGVEQRDIALRAGAQGATTLVWDGSKLLLAGMKVMPEGSEEACSSILLKLDPKKGDVIVVGSASDDLTAELAAKAAALELLKSRTSI